jgi:hypothetical protein
MENRSALTSLEWTAVILAMAVALIPLAPLAHGG